MNSKAYNLVETDPMRGLDEVTLPIIRSRKRPVQPDTQLLVTTQDFLDHVCETLFFK